LRHGSKNHEGKKSTEKVFWEKIVKGWELEWEGKVRGPDYGAEKENTRQQGLARVLKD